MLGTTDISSHRDRAPAAADFRAAGDQVVSERPWDEFRSERFFADAFEECLPLLSGQKLKNLVIE